MVFETAAETRAQDFIDEIKGLFRRRDDLIYELDTEVSKPNSISLNSIGRRDAWIIATLYNVSDPDSYFGRRWWMHLGALDADVDVYEDHGETIIEITSRFD